MLRGKYSNQKKSSYLLRLYKKNNSDYWKSVSKKRERYKYHMVIKEISVFCTKTSISR
jgi:hypothetical protein